MLTHIITHQNRSHYHDELLDMHKLRKQLFINTLKWAALSARDDGGEYDEYDDEHAVYLLVLDDQSQILAGMRMRRTTDICMIADKFPHLVETGPESVRGPDIWEGSRYMLAPHMRGPVGRRSLASLHLAALELGLSRGITRFIGMCDTHFVAGLRTTGWRIRHIGLPSAYAEGECFAFEVEVSADALVDARSQLGISERVTVEHPGRMLPATAIDGIEFIRLYSRLRAEQRAKVLALVRDAVSQQAAT